MAQGTCSVPACPNDLKMKGLCGSHRRRQLKGKPLDAPFRGSWKNTICSVSTCDIGGRMQRGMCTGHYSRWRESGDVRADVPFQTRFGRTVCQVADCGEKELARNLCSTHYQRMLARGTTDPRTHTVAKCSIKGCGEPARCRGLCNSHHRKSLKYGDPLTVGRRASKANRGLCKRTRCEDPVHADALCLGHFEKLRKFRAHCDEIAEREIPTVVHAEGFRERFWAQVEKTDSCWLWSGSLNRARYGQMYLPNGYYRTAHRLSWVLAGRSLIDGLVIDHVCHTNDHDCPGGPCVHRRCVNPGHLEQVPQRTNILRGRGGSANNDRKDRCKRGHEFDLLNTSWNNDGSRHCKKCSSDRAKRKYQAEKALKRAA